MKANYILRSITAPDFVNDYNNLVNISQATRLS